VSERKARVLNKMIIKTMRFKSNNPKRQKEHRQKAEGPKEDFWFLYPEFLSTLL